MSQNLPTNSLKIKEFFYYIFFAIMLAAKGCGLDSGDKLYYILSLIAFISVICKICMTEYNSLEILFIFLLGIIAFLTYINSGRFGFVLSVLAIIGIKDMEYEKIFRLGLIVYSVSFIGTIFSAAVGIIPNALVVHEKGDLGEVIRWGMGFSTGNVFHIAYFILISLILYNLKQEYSFKHLFFLLCGNIIVFIFSLSYTGVAVTAFYLILNMLAIKIKKLNNIGKILCQIPLLFCLLFSFGIPFLLDYPIVQKLNNALQARLSFSYYYLTNQSITWLGTRMKNVPYFWVIMDNGYVYILMTFGIIAFLLFCIGYALLIIKYSRIIPNKKNKSAENNVDYLIRISMIFSFLLYGIMEQFISNAFMNISLLFMGELIFHQTCYRKNMKIPKKGFISKLVIWGEQTIRLKIDRKSIIKYIARIQKNKRKIYLFSGILGLCFAILPPLFNDKINFVTVPLTAVNYVDAQSVIFHTKVTYSDKDELKKVMNSCKEIVETETFEKYIIQQVKQLHVDVEIHNELDNLTVGELASMIEFSMPQYVHNSGEYNTFRLRLIESDCDISTATYKLILDEMIKGLHKENKNYYLTSNTMFEERVYKSSGTDRIEHIDNKENYYIKKSGNIVIVEMFRNAISRLIVGTIIGALSFGIYYNIKKI